MYLMRRNDKAWGRLSAEEKELVLAANKLQNLERKGYADPENYGGGKIFDSEGSRIKDSKGFLLARYLEENQPESVIEIGPGSGFQTRAICEFPSVRKYIGVDINPAFIDFLRARLGKVVKQKTNFSFELFSGDFESMSIPKADSLILLSAIHHIPDRFELFDWAAKVLKPGGTIFSFDPSHYFPRMQLLLRKFLREYYKAEYRSELANYSTHSFCTSGEFRRIFRQSGVFEIEKCTFIRFEFPILIKKVMPRILISLGAERSPEGWMMMEEPRFLLRYFSNRIALVARRTPNK